MNKSIKDTLRKAKSFADDIQVLSRERNVNYTKNSLRPVVVPKQFVTEVPQADIVERNLEAFERKDWRKHFSSKLSGTGLEIGPLHRPMTKHDGMNVQYIDRYSVKQLREHYPELNDLPLVEADILGDAQTLDNVDDEQYEFVISAHVIEHMKNPIGAIEQWVRVLKPGGLLYLVVPDKRVIFDKKRVRTTLEHLMLDYKEQSAERDYEHYLDYAVHVNNQSGMDAIKEADRLEETDYSIHFHVFVPSDIINMLDWFDKNVSPIRVLEGPCLTPGSDEFHFLIKKGE